MGYKRPRSINTSQMPSISSTAVLDNFYPCLCNGKTDVIDRDWNEKGWMAEFHIPDRDCIGKEAAALQGHITDGTMAFVYIIYGKDAATAKGTVIYDLHTGKIQTFTCDSDGKNEAETFIKNLIHYFGEMNYVAKMNAMDRPIKSTSTGFANSTDTNGITPKTSVEYIFTIHMEQPAYTPKRNIYGKSKKTAPKKTAPKKSTHGKSKASKSTKHTHNKIVYKTEFWEKAGYYRKDGTYVKPCSCRRHVTA